MHSLKMNSLSKRFFDPQISDPEKRNEFTQKVSRKAFVEQGGTGTESGNLYLDHRPCGKREKLPPGDETKDHSCLGLEAFREGKNIRELEMESFSPDSRTAHDWRNDLMAKLLKNVGKIEKGTKEGRRIIRKRIFLLFMLLLSMIFSISRFSGEDSAAEGLASGRLLTEQEVATEKFFSSLEATLAQKFFDYRKRPIVRVAIFDFTDEAGNVVKSGRELADKFTKRLYFKPQFEVVSPEKINRYLSWNGLTALGRLDAEGLHRLQRRINTMDPANGIHALVRGEIKKGVGLSLHVSVSMVDFQFKVGAFELKENIFESLTQETEIPLPTEQALQEANEILVRAESHFLEEGRLLVLVNTRGNVLLETEYVGQFNQDQPFPWTKIPYALTSGQAEVTKPGQIEIGLGNLPLSPLGRGKISGKRLEYSFLHGKCATNAVYFDEIIPAQSHRLIASFLDLKNNETYSESAEVPVYSGSTTVAVLSFYVPSEKERIRNKQIPRIDVFKLFGKGTEIFPSR